MPVRPNFRGPGGALGDDLGPEYAGDVEERILAGTDESRPPKDSFELLCELVSKSGLRMTFDPLRDSTKGCSRSCRGWEKEASSWCAGHRAAIDRGDYCPVDRDIFSGDCPTCWLVRTRLWERIKARESEPKG